MCVCEGERERNMTKREREIRQRERERERERWGTLWPQNKHILSAPHWVSVAKIIGTVSHWHYERLSCILLAQTCASSKGSIWQIFTFANCKLSLTLRNFLPCHHKGSIPYNFFFVNNSSLDRNLWNFSNLCEIFRSKFRCNYKSVIHGSVKVYIINPRQHSKNKNDSKNFILFVLCNSIGLVFI